MTYEPWTDEQKERLHQAVEDQMTSGDIAALFPNRTTHAVYTKIRYERLRRVINGRRAAGRNNNAPAISDADYIATCLRNEDQDKRFQDAMKAALAAGLERMPVPAKRCDEFRPAHLQRQSGTSFGQSPALLCAEFGAR